MEKQVKTYKGPAGGWGALASSFRHISEQGIVGRGATTLLKANQPDGFDCPGCAWPDKNQHSTFEFCENGVKAVAAEATRRTVPRPNSSRSTASSRWPRMTTTSSKRRAG